MSDDLVKRLRGRAKFLFDSAERKSPDLFVEAANRIEQLERALVDVGMDHGIALNKLAAEKVLADQFDELNARAIMGVGWSKTDALELAEAYRKARGL